MNLTTNRIILRKADVRDRVLAAVDLAALPVIETIGPQGKNVLFETSVGTTAMSNDGVTIIKNIAVKDRLASAVIDLVRSGSRRTNDAAGDATSTTVLFTREGTRKAHELEKKGVPQRKIREAMNRVAEKLIERINEQKRVVKTPEDALHIATISANNDTEIAKDVVRVVEAAGLDGMVFLEVNPQQEKCEIDIQPGFKSPNGMVYQNLYPDTSRPVARYKDIPTIIFDKKLYYAEEAEHILRVAKDLGYAELLIVAKDFIGDAPNTFIANHMQGVIKLVLTKIEEDSQLTDLAVYLGAEVVSEGAGRRVDSITKDDFFKVKSVFADPHKTLIEHYKSSKALEARVEGVRQELKEKPNASAVKGRLASLTNGIVTIKIGGRTDTEAQEKVYRYEDAINALRTAKRDGYLVGGGLAIWNAFRASDYPTKIEKEFAWTLATASLERLATNSEIDMDYDELTKEIGFNALTGKYENLLKAGVIEPLKAVEMSIKNAVSVADSLISIGTFILIDETELYADND